MIAGTFATRLAQAGVDLYTISKLLGHRSIASSQRYAHPYVESLRSGVMILDKVEEVATRKMVSWGSRFITFLSRLW
jgi:site-specific recombinase XerC